jgi:DNA repair protein RadC
MHELKGHRKRVKNRFISSEIRTFTDYELLEMMLFYVVPRKDTKQIARDLMNKYGSIAAILSIDESEITSIEGLGESASVFFKLLLDIQSRLILPKESKNYNVLSNWISVLNYCRLTQGYKKIEYFRVLYLNKKNCLIADEVSQNGTIDRVHLYPREIAKKVILHNAASIILVHNHPSGEAKPSNADIDVTNAVANASLHDHIIITENGSFSFKQNRLL